MEEQDMPRHEALADQFCVKLSTVGGFSESMLRILDNWRATHGFIRFFKSLLKCTLGNFCVCFPGEPLGQTILLPVALLSQECLSWLLDVQKQLHGQKPTKDVLVDGFPASPAS